MIILAWDDKFKTGIDLIDNQHKELFDLINIYNVRSEKTFDLTQTQSLLSQLTNYTLSHFQAEEAHMLAAAYPRLQEHKALHKSLQFELKRLVTELTDKSGDQAAVAKKTGSFIADWLLDHVGKYDYDFLVFYKNKEN